MNCADAARAYAARGWHVFPAPVGQKKSHISARHDAAGRKWGATANPDEAEGYWQRWSDANLGIATGPASGIWVLDIDTADGHGVDGFAGLAALTAAHGPLPETLTAQSPSGSRHLYWQWPAPGRNVPNTVRLAGHAGLDVRGDGGMVIAPPSRKADGRAYEWVNSLPVAHAPEWLLQLVCAVPTLPAARPQRITPASLAELQELLGWIDPDAGGYDQWSTILMAIHDATGGSDDGLQLADDWSSRGKLYEPGEVAGKWNTFTAGRPNGATIASVASHAKEAGADVTGIAGRHRLAAALSAMPLPGASAMPLPGASAMPLPGASAMPLPGASAMPLPPAPVDPLQALREHLQADPTTAPARLAGLIADLAPADRAQILHECKAYGIKREMEAAVKRSVAERIVAAGSPTAEEVLSKHLCHFYLVRNHDGQPVAFDARGDTHPQTRAALREAYTATVPVMAENGVKQVKVSDAWWDDPATPTYDLTGFDPHAPEAFLDGTGRVVRNQYRPGHVLPPVTGDAGPWLEVVRRNFPDAGDQHTLLSALAHMVQRPGVLLRWAPVMQGTPGCGKGTIAEAVTYAHGRHNAAHPSPDTIATDFNGYMHRKTLVVVNEIGDHTKRELSALAEKLKPWITDSPVSIHAKGRDAFDAPNHACWIFTTNHLHCMLATPGERRYAHFISALQSEEAAKAAFPGTWWQDYRRWWDGGGAEAVRAYLTTYAGDVPSTAPATTSTERAMLAGEGAAAGVLREALTAADPGFRGGWISANALREALSAEGIRVPPGSFMQRLVEPMGFTVMHRVSTSPAEAMRFPSSGPKTRLYCRPGVVTLDAPAQAYDAAQGDRPKPAGPGDLVRMPGV
jgi:hypothetical protein